MNVEKISWLGHAGVRIADGLTVVVDPYQITGGFHADMILITHEHDDHLSMQDIEKICSDNTEFVVPERNAGLFQGKVHCMKPGQTQTIRDVRIEAVPAYNIGKPYHPVDREYLGYVFALNGITYYHTGDSDLIPEMKKIQTDVTFLPVGGTFTMTAEEAAEAASIVKAKLAIPIHWGCVVGGRRDADIFAELCPCDVEILKAI